MERFLRWLAELKGVEIEPGAELRFELSAFPSSGGLSLLVVLGSLLAVLLVVLLYRRDRGKLTGGQRLFLGGLRALAVLLALLMLFEPNVVAVKREVRPGHVLLLVDTSQSMAHVDAFRRDGVRQLADDWRRVGVGEPSATPRLELVKALLRHDGSAMLRELQTKNRLMAYGFGATAEALPSLSPEPVPEDADPATLAVVLPDLDKVEATGGFSNPGQAVRTALERSRDAAVAGVIVLSDGRRNLGPQGAEVARLLAQRDVPRVLVVPVGDPSETQSVHLERIEAPEKVFQRDPFAISAEIRAQGYEDIQLGVRLVLLPEGAAADAEGEVVQLESVRLGRSTPVARVDFEELRAETAGARTYRVELMPPDGEPPNREAHTRSARVQVLGEQTKVLLLAGGPTPEYHVLRDTLMRDKTIDVACWLQSADPDFPQDGNTSLENLPDTREGLAEIDVFIFLDPDGRKLTPDFCTMLVEQIDQDGAGLWWIAGEKFTLPSMRAEAPTRPIAELLPVQTDMTAAERSIGLGYAFDTPWNYVLTPLGERHPAARIADGQAESKLLWERLPGFYWSFPIASTQPAAVTLVTHGNPNLRQLDGKPETLLAAQTVGAGRVLFTGTDETYRWRGRFKSAYDRFWVKGIRYLFEGRLRAGDTRMKIELSSHRVELGESLTVTADAKDQDFQPLLASALELRVSRSGYPEQTLRLAPVDRIPGRFEANLRPEAPGFYRLWAESGEATLEVVRAAIEGQGPVDVATLSAIAAIAGGEVLSNPSALRDAARSIPSTTTTDVFRTLYPCWDTWVTVALLVLILAVEWWFRKRFNLL